MAWYLTGNKHTYTQIDDDQDTRGHWVNDALDHDFFHFWW